MLEESNETIFQMKDAKYFPFKELQLNMDNRLKSHIIYKKHSLKTVHTGTNKTIVEVDIHRKKWPRRDSNQGRPTPIP